MLKIVNGYGLLQVLSNPLLQFIYKSPQLGQVAAAESKVTNALTAVFSITYGYFFTSDVVGPS
jgi:hypothetical protein